eukprot:10836085-Alexandrium_andersonii.AAC.1
MRSVEEALDHHVPLRRMQAHVLDAVQGAGASWPRNERQVGPEAAPWRSGECHGQSRAQHPGRRSAYASHA